jgi:energy-coupling factor transporter ATP-binding protein EcfA2
MKLKVNNFTIEQALENVGSLAEQTAHQVDDKYVKRPDGQIERMARILTDRSYQQKFLLAGQDGCGKTTELNRLEELVANQYTVVRCDHRHFHDLNHDEDIEFLFVLLRAFMSAAEEMAPEIQYNIAIAFKRIFASSRMPDFELKASILGIPLFKKKVPLKEDIHREASIREEFGMFRSELNSTVHKAIEAIKSYKERHVLLIVDDLEKFQYEQVFKLMTENYQILSSLPCAVVYTVPLWLLFEDKRSILEEVFHIINLANTPFVDKRDNVLEKGMFFFDKVAKRRIGRLWTDLDDTLKVYVAAASGGHLRQFLSLLRSLLLEAYDSPDKKIEKEHMKRSLIQIATSFRRILNPEDREILEYVRKTREYNYSLPRRLLNNYSVLEYWHPDLGTWYDVNPMALPNHPFNLLKKLNEKDLTLA